MSDPAHKETDRLIRKLERRIAKEYSRAEKNVKRKLDDYLRRFKKKDEKWREWVAEGKKTKKQYNEWKIGQIAIGGRWEAMRDTLADDYHNANMIARSVIQGYMPEAYAINHNYGTYEVEHGLRVDTSYTLYDRDTVQRLYDDQAKLYHAPGKKLSKNIAAGKDIAWNRTIIQSVMLQSILQGEAIPKIADRLSKQVGDSNRAAAIRNARTMITGAQNAGRIDSYNRAQEMGIELGKMWVATLDSRTRHSHRMLDGEVQPNNKKFSNGCMYPGDPDGAPAEIYNCFTGNVYVATNSGIERSYKHKYTGELITVKTAGGVEFTCTPNHPILTPGGWIAANLLNEGDDLLVTNVVDPHTSGINPYINHVFTRFKALHKLLAKSGSKRTCSLGVNFHGDIPTADVEIVRQEGLLQNDRNIRKPQKHSKLGFTDSDKMILRQSPLSEHFFRIWKATLGYIRGFCEAFPFFRRSLGHSKVHSLGTVTGGDISIPEYTIDNLPATTMIRRELLDGLSGKVFRDNIISIDKISGSTHVYNLQTENGYYFVNSSITKTKGMYNGNMCAIAKNCRCTLIAALQGFERDISDLGLRHNSNLGNMTYAQWKAEKKSTSNPITLPEEKARNIKWAYINEYRRN